MDSRFLRDLALRLLGSWLVLSLLGWFFGRDLIALLLPVINLAVNAVADGYSSVLSITREAGGELIHMEALATRPIPVSPELTINPGARLTAGVHLVHALVPIVLLYSLLLAWPVKTAIDRLWLLGIGVPLALLALLLTVPFQLTTHIDTMLVDYAAEGGQARQLPWSTHWSMFNESGGRWMVPVVLAGLAIGLRRWSTLDTTSGPK